MPLLVHALLFFCFVFALQAQPLDLVFTLETTPGTEQATGLIRPSELGDHDRAGIVAFHRSAEPALALTADKERLRRKLEEVGAYVGVAVGINDGAPLNRSFTVNLAEAIGKAGTELSSSPSDRRRAILVFYAGEDPSLAAHMDSLETMLESNNIRLYGVLVFRTDMTGPPGMPSIGRPGGRRPEPIQSPIVTTRLLSRLAKRSGGKVFETNWRLLKILESARRP
jgi:hypothetical protein